jgi:glycosyltransferase involved in cell wall biosynthesis
MKILQVVGGMNRGGLETWLMRILRYIDREAYNIDFVVAPGRECDYDLEIRSLGSRIIPCSYHQYKPWAFYNSFRRILNEKGPYDVVHSQVYLFSGIVLHAAKKQNIPIRVAHMHPLRDVEKKSFLRRIYKKWMYKLIAENANCIITPSNETQLTYQEVINSSGIYFDILPNCVELKKFGLDFNKASYRRKLSLPSDKPIIVYIARFVPHKNHRQLLRVADLINKDTYKAHFVIVGSHGELLDSLYLESSKRSYVSMFTNLGDITKILMASDIFFFPSLEEGFGVVATEACAAGLPIVSTNLSTIKEACPPSYHDFMIEPNDDNAACKNLLLILENSQLKEKLSHDGKIWSLNFSVESSNRKLINIYKSLSSL